MNKMTEPPTGTCVHRLPTETKPEQENVDADSINRVKAHAQRDDKPKCTGARDQSKANAMWSAAVLNSDVGACSEHAQTARPSQALAVCHTTLVPYEVIVKTFQVLRMLLLMPCTTS